jgi:hypothetical protein
MDVMQDGRTKKLNSGMNASVRNWNTAIAAFYKVKAASYPGRVRPNGKWRRQMKRASGLPAKSCPLW